MEFFLVRIFPYLDSFHTVKSCKRNISVNLITDWFSCAKLVSTLDIDSIDRMQQKFFIIGCNFFKIYFHAKCNLVNSFLKFSWMESYLVKFFVYFSQRSLKMLAHYSKKKKKIKTKEKKLENRIKSNRLLWMQLRKL